MVIPFMPICSLPRQIEAMPDKIPRSGENITKRSSMPKKNDGTTNNPKKSIISVAIEKYPSKLKTNAVYGEFNGIMQIEFPILRLYEISSFLD